MNNPTLYLFYDGDCPLCRRFKEWVNRLDTESAICALPLDAAELSTRFPHIDLQEARQRLTVCNKLDQVFHDVEALQQLTHILPGLRRLAWIYRLPGVTPTVQRAYRTVNRNRKRLCLQCGEKWMPSSKYSRRNKDASRRRRR